MIKPSIKMTCNLANSVTQKLIYNLRNLFPDNEYSTFTWVMHQLAKAAFVTENRPKCIIIYGDGSNGKSFLIELFMLSIDKHGLYLPKDLLMCKEDAHKKKYIRDIAKSCNKEYDDIRVCCHNEHTEFFDLDTSFMDDDKCLIIGTNNSNIRLKDLDDDDYISIHMMIKFVDEPKYCNERKRDPSLTNSCYIEDKNVQNAFLSLLHHFHDAHHA